MNQLQLDEMMQTLKRIENKLLTGSFNQATTARKDENWLTEAEAMSYTGKSRATLKMYRNGRRVKGELAYPPILHKWRSINGRDIQYWKPELDKIFS